MSKATTTKQAEKAEVLTSETLDAFRQEEATNSETLPEIIAPETARDLQVTDSIGDVSFQFEDESQLVEVTAAYLAMKEGESQNFVFMGMSTTQFPGDGGEMMEKEIVSLIDIDKNSFISAATVLVSACRRIKHFPCLIRIIHNGQKKLPGAKHYDDFKMLTNAINLQP